jgi:hypothetical protein
MIPMNFFTDLPLGKHAPAYNQLGMPFDETWPDDLQ